MNKLRSIFIPVVAVSLLLTPTVASAVEFPGTAFTKAECVAKDGWTEVVYHEAVGTPKITVDNPDYVAPTYTPAHTEWVEPVYTPAVGTPTIQVEQDNPEYVPAVEEVSHTEYEFKHKKHDHPNSPRWETDPNWNADSNPNSKGWYSTGNTRVIVTTPGHPAQGEPTILVTIDNPDYVAPTYTPGYDKEVPAQYTPAEGKPTIQVDNPDYEAAWTEVIEHEAIVCDDEEEAPAPEDEETPAPEDDVTPDAEEPVEEAQEVPKAPQIERAAALEADTAAADRTQPVAPVKVDAGI